MKNSDVAEEFTNALGRISVIFWLAAVVTNETPPDTLENFVDDGPELWERTFGLDDLGHYDFPEGFIEMLIDKDQLGFLACVETPVLHYVSKDGNARGYSWGLHHVEWVYAETIDELKEKALKCVEAFSEADIKALRKEDAETLREESK